jgi:sec-independent protein translocase protein TatC
MNSPDDDADDRRSKPFVEHLADLRSAVLWSLAAMAVGIGATIPLNPLILRLLKAPLAAAGKNPDQFLIVLGVGGGFSTAIRLSTWGGILLSLPLVLWAVAWFVFPGLTRRERRAVLRALGAGALLFAGGVAFGGYTLPLALKLMFAVNDWLGIACNFVELDNYVGFILKLLLAFGLSFEFPIVLVALGSLEIVTSRQLREKRRHVIVIIFIVAMVLTPPDPLSQVLMAIPMTILYEASIWIVRAQERKRASAET